MAKVKVYTTPTCVYCVTVKNFLKEKNVDFQEIDVSQDKEAADQMIEKTGQMGVPVIEIDQEVVVGFDRDKIIKLLNL
jgi:glutaredoxin 3